MDIANKSKEYHTSDTTIFSCQYHIVFCPKFRRSVLKDGIDSRLKELIAEYGKKIGFNILDMEVMPDHVHLLLDIPPTKRVRDVVTTLKGFTAHSLRNEFPSLKTRLPSLWTRSCFISSVGTVSLEVVKRYIDNQKLK